MPIDYSMLGFVDLTATKQENSRVRKERFERSQLVVR